MNKLKKIAGLIITVSLFFAFSLDDQSVGANGFGVSGSFSNYHYKIVPGETIETPNVNVVFFNNYDVDIQVEITPNGPDGVDFILDESIVGIDANSSITIPIGITADINTVPGEYMLGISARVLPADQEGISVVGAAELRTNLTVFGEAGDLRINVVDVFGDSFTGNIRLFRVEGGAIAPVDETNGTFIEDRYIPATYRVFVYYEGLQVAQKDIVLNDGDTLTEAVTVQTLFINRFDINPMFNQVTEEFTTARLSYTLENPYINLENVDLTVDVSYEGEFQETFEGGSLSIIPEGEFSGNFIYFPSSAWQAGTYEFVMHASFENDGETIRLASSRIREFEVPESAVDTPTEDPEPEPIDDPEPEPVPEPDSEGLGAGAIVLLTLLGVAVVGAAGFFFWWFILAKRDDDDEEEDLEEELGSGNESNQDSSNDVENAQESAEQTPKE